MAQEIQIIKPEQWLPVNIKRLAFTLAAVVFIAALAIANSYERLIAPLRPTVNTEGKLGLSKFESNFDFLSAVKLGTGISEVKVDAVEKIEEVVPEKHTINRKGDELLVSGDQIIRITSNKVSGYLLGAQTPSWTLELTDGAISSSRMMGEELVVATSYHLPENVTCPIPIYTTNSVTTSRKCTDILSNGSGGNTLYSVVSVNTKGQIIGSASVLGGSNDSEIYLSDNSFYFTQNVRSENTDALYGFLSERAVSFLPAEIITKVQKLENYDIGSEAKIVELETLLRDYYDSLPGASKEEFYLRYSSELSSYLAETGSLLGRTEISEFGPDLGFSNTISINGYTPKSSAYAHNGSLFVLTVSTNTQGYSGKSSLYKLENGEYMKLILEYLPRSLSFGGGWMFAMRDDVLASVELSTLAYTETNMAGEFIILPSDDSFLTVRPVGGVVVIESAGRLAGQNKVELSESWGQFKENISAFAYNSSKAFISGNNDYIISSEGPKIEETLDTLSSSSSYLSDNHLYTLGERLYIINLQDGTTVSETDVLY